MFMVNVGKYIIHGLFVSIPGNSAGDLFGIVKWKGHFESPGIE